MRLVILCEGDTEKRVLKDFLAEYCTEFTQVQVINAGCAGNLIKEFPVLAQFSLDDTPDTVVFCLIDLLHIPFKFPKQVQVHPDLYHAQYAYLQEWMCRQVTESLRDRFYAFPVVMELETWLLADVEALRQYFRTPLIKSWPAPENVVDPTPT